MCKCCKNEYSKKYKKDNPDKMKSYAKKWRDANPDKEIQQNENFANKFPIKKRINYNMDMHD